MLKGLQGFYLNSIKHEQKLFWIWTSRIIAETQNYFFFGQPSVWHAQKAVASFVFANQTAKESTTAHSLHIGTLSFHGFQV